MEEDLRHRPTDRHLASDPLVLSEKPRNGRRRRGPRTRRRRRRRRGSLTRERWGVWMALHEVARAPLFVPGVAG
jgi:hypothetical protein